jgi:hypothetical protein
VKGTQNVCDVYLVPLADKLKLFEPLFREKKEIQALYEKYSALQRKLAEMGENGFSQLRMQQLSTWDGFREYQTHASTTMSAFKAKVGMLKFYEPCILLLILSRVCVCYYIMLLM